MSVCDCPICKRHRKLRMLYKKYNISAEDRRFFDENEMLLMMAETDRDIAELKLKGEWPGFDK